MRVFDQDQFLGDSVDMLYIEETVPVTAIFTPIQAYEGTARWAFIYLSFKVTIVDNSAMDITASCSMGCCKCTCL